MSDQLLGIMTQTAILLLAGGAMLVRNDSSLKNFQKELSKVQQELALLAQVVTKQAVQDERLNEQARRMGSMEQRIEDLRRGRGYVTREDQAAETVDREYR